MDDFVEKNEKSGIKKLKFQYFLNAYISHIDFSGKYIEGIWGRFKLLLSINMALFATYATIYIKEPSSLETMGWLILILGFINSAISYLFAAQERYIQHKHREQINGIKKKLEDIIDDNLPAMYDSLDQIDERKKRFIFENWLSWRSRTLSVSKIPSFSSILFLSMWVLLIIFNSFK